MASSSTKAKKTESLKASPRPSRAYRYLSRAAHQSRKWNRFFMNPDDELAF
jgi:hypothetical protein